MDLPGAVLIARLEAVHHVVTELVGGGEGGVLLADGLEVVECDELSLDLLHDGLGLLAVGCLSEGTQEVGDLLTNNLPITIGVENGEDIFHKLNGRHFCVCDVFMCV